MYTKTLDSISLENIAQLQAPLSSLPLLSKEKVVGIFLQENEINYDLYTGFADISIPHILIIELSADTLAKDLSGQTLSLAEKLLPVLMHYAYYQVFALKPLLFKTQAKIDSPAIQNWNENFLQSLKKLGIRNVSPAYTRSVSKNGKAIFEKLQQQEDETEKSIAWEVSFSGNDAFSVSQVPNEMLQLWEENAKLRSDKSTLLKNIYDLNNYYRFVRGEVNFKYHNRDEDEKKGADNNAQPVGDLANATSSHAWVSGSDDIRVYYNKVYEELPFWYKKVGTLLKIAFFKKELLYYISKKHKQVFFNMIQSLPKEKQLKTWYYYEYEILPGWYKRIGKLLVKK